jgi:hypothetical protein
VERRREKKEKDKAETPRALRFAETADRGC